MRGSPYSERQRVALAYAPKVPALLSLLGLIWIVVEVLRDKGKLHSVYHRLMLGFSCYGIVFSICTFLGTWPVPKDAEPEIFRPHAASGTTATCTAQGFFLQIGICYNFYVAALGIYYVLAVGYNWHKIKLIKFERIVHVIIAMFALGTGTAGLILQLFNNSLFWCGIYHHPYSCDTTAEINCTRGFNATFYIIFFGFLERVCCWMIMLISMVMLYRMAREQAHKMRRYSSGVHLAEQNVNEVTKMALSYLGVFIGFNIFFLIFRAIEVTGQIAPFALVVLAIVLAPLTGLGFTLIYLRPRFERYVLRQQSRERWKCSNICKVFQWGGVTEDDHKLGNQEEE